MDSLLILTEVYGWGMDSYMTIRLIEQFEFSMALIYLNFVRSISSIDQGIHYSEFIKNCVFYLQFVLKPITQMHHGHQPNHQY